MPHRFTEPSPTSTAGHTVVEVFVSDWEIECCAPPPAVGEPGTWRLGFVPAADGHEFDRDTSWRVERRDGWTAVTDGPVVACVRDSATAGPEPGRRTLRGHVFGTVHGGILPDDVPGTTGRVERVRLVSQVYRLDAARTLRPVPGTSRLTEVQRSPRWFTGGSHRVEPGTDLRMETGVLLVLAVPRR